LHVSQTAFGKFSKYFLRKDQDYSHHLNTFSRIPPDSFFTIWICELENKGDIMLMNKKTLWIILIIALVIAGGGYGLYTWLAPAEAEVAETPAVQTAVARQGDLVVSASGAGSVISAVEIGLGFDESGALTELFVSVGEKVEAGQVLARLDTGKSDAEIALAVAQAQLDALNAQQAVEDIYASADMDAAKALKAIEDAEAALEDLYDVELQQAEAQQAAAEAEQVLADTQRDYNNVRLTASQSEIDAAYAELVLADHDLKYQQDLFDEVANKPDTNLEKAHRQLRLNEAQAVYDSALSYYNALTGTGSDLDKALTEAALQAAQAQLAEAQQEWERIKHGPTPGEIALAEATLKVANAEWEILKDGVDPEEIALAEATLANAEANLELVLEEKAILELIAPINGTILSISADVGEEIDTGAIIVLADLSLPVLEIYLDEIDLNKVGLGYEIEVIFDALPDDVYTGHVIQVDPSLQTVSNVNAVRVLAQLDPESFAKPQDLPVGLNASVEVIGGRTEGAVLVPVEALREIAPGEFSLFVMEGGEPKLRIVSVGLMDYTSAEIINGLEVGDIVTTGIVETE
jgi:multidrug efflux pump subunit AcrA (membrane-fusion protein)